MKNVKLFPSLIAIIFTFGCNRNPEEQKSKVPIEEKPSSVIKVKKEINKQEKSNSYAFDPKPEAKEISAIKPIQSNRKPLIDKNKQLPQSEVNIEKAGPEISEKLYDIFKSFEKPFQTFTFLPQRDTVFIGIEKTTLQVKANSFVTETTNQPVSGPIQIKLKEYYSISDMLLANLSTKSGNELLETGGMVYLEAFSGSEKLKLKSDRQIEIGFPFKEKKEGMQTFNGEWKNDVINWIPGDSTTSPILITTDVMPTFPGGIREMQKFISAQIMYPDKARKQGIDGMVVLSFVVQKDGNLADLRILKSVSPELDSEALRVVKLMPKWSPGQKDEMDVPVRFTLPIRFSIDGGINGLISNLNQDINKEEERFTKKFEKRNKDEFKTTELSSISQYMILTSNLGWINCDAFYGSKSRVNFSVISKDNSEQDIKIVFHKIRSIFPGTKQGKKYLFNNIPKNEKITIVALKKIDNKPYLAIKEAITSNLTETNLVYEEVTLEKLKIEMQKLNY